MPLKTQQLLNHVSPRVLEFVKGGVSRRLENRSQPIRVAVQVQVGEWRRVICSQWSTWGTVSLEFCMEHNSLTSESRAVASRSTGWDIRRSPVVWIRHQTANSPPKWSTQQSELHRQNRGVALIDVLVCTSHGVKTKFSKAAFINLCRWAHNRHIYNL